MNNYYGYSFCFILTQFISSCFRISTPIFICWVYQWDLLTNLIFKPNFQHSVPWLDSSVMVDIMHDSSWSVFTEALWTPVKITLCDRYKSILQRRTKHYVAILKWVLYDSKKNLAMRTIQQIVIYQKYVSVKL